MGFTTGTPGLSDRVAEFDKRAFGRAPDYDELLKALCAGGHLARLHTNSSVTPAGLRGNVNFISSAVMAVTIRR